MLDALVGDCNKALESTLRLQKEMLRHWTVQKSSLQFRGLASALCPAAE